MSLFPRVRVKLECLALTAPDDTFGLQCQKPGQLLDGAPRLESIGTQHRDCSSVLGIADRYVAYRARVRRSCHDGEFLCGAIVRAMTPTRLVAAERRASKVHGARVDAGLEHSLRRRAKGPEAC